VFPLKTVAEFFLASIGLPGIFGFLWFIDVSLQSSIFRYSPCVYVLTQMSSYKDTSHIVLGPTLFY
jgi:hypothetical protein